jgi:hypothetical protein
MVPLMDTDCHETTTYLLQAPAELKTRCHQLACTQYAEPQLLLDSHAKPTFNTLTSNTKSKSGGISAPDPFDPYPSLLGIVMTLSPPAFIPSNPRSNPGKKETSYVSN